MHFSRPPPERFAVFGVYNNVKVFSTRRRRPSRLFRYYSPTTARSRPVPEDAFLTRNTPYKCMSLMIIIPVPFIRAISGKIMGLKSSTHVRTNSQGTVYVCRNPHQTTATTAQLRARQRLRQANASLQVIKADPVLLSAYQAAFERQSADSARYHRLNDFILHCLLSEDSHEPKGAAR